MTLVGIASADYQRADFNSEGQEHWGGAGWARLGQYVPFIGVDFDLVVGTLWREGSTGFSIEDSNKERHRPDIIIMQRMMHEGIGESVKDANRHGQFILNDIDDWFFGLDPNNNAFKATHPKTLVTKYDTFGREYTGPTVEHTNAYRTNLANSNLLVVSTPYLADRLSNVVRCPITVVPNYVDVKRFHPVRQLPGVPMFGWAGSTGHRSGDLETVAGVLRPAVNSGEIRMQHSGNHLGYPSFASVIGVDDDKIKTKSAVTATEYPSLLDFDVGIVPLRDTPFNEAKSYIKGLEYAASGIPFIAAALPEYSRLWQDWGGCFHIAKRPKDWISGIKRYMDYSNRRGDSQTILDRVQDHDIHFGAEQWRDLLKEI